MTGWTGDWAPLRRRIAGEVIAPGVPGYEAARRPALARFHDSRPRAIVRATSTADVAETITFARPLGLRTTPRSGGHCFAGRSSSGDVVIDVSPMRSVSVADGIATVGAGTRLGELDDALAKHGQAIPAGCGTTVGIAGLTLGGGFGILGRAHGLACDHLLRARVVLADGSVVDCDERRDAELFWALRGAGGGHLGVVTSLVFRTLPAPWPTCFHLVWRDDHATAIVATWQDWAPTAPDELDASLRVTVSGDVDPVAAVTLSGALLGSETDATRLLDHFIARVGVAPNARVVRRMPYRDAKRYLSEPGSPRPRLMFSRSEFFRRQLPHDVIDSWLRLLTDERDPGQTRELILTPWNGAYRRTPSDATAFVHRTELFMVEHVVVVDSDVPSAREWLTRSWAAVHPWGSGRVYPNFPDPDLEDWAAAYYGTNHERLVLAKRTYDPDDWFRFPQSLGSADPPRLSRSTPSYEGTVP